MKQKKKARANFSFNVKVKSWDNWIDWLKGYKVQQNVE